MGDTFGGCILRGLDRNRAVFAMTRCRTRQIRKRVFSDRTRRPIEDVSCKHIYRGGHMTRWLGAAETDARQGAAV